MGIIYVFVVRCNPRLQITADALTSLLDKQTISERGHIHVHTLEYIQRHPGEVLINNTFCFVLHV